MRISANTFYHKLRETNLGQEYLQIVSVAEKSDKVKCNLHHIQPKGLQGSDENSNLVRLSEFNHCKAHAILAQIFPRYETLKPLVKLNYGQFTRLSSLEQEYLIERYYWNTLLDQAKHISPPYQVRKKISSSLKGRKQSQEEILIRSQSRRKLHNGEWFSEESRKKISASNTGRKANPETLKKKSEFMKNRWKDESYRIAVMNAFKGRKSHPCSEETKKKLSEIRKMHPVGTCSLEGRKPLSKQSREKISKKKKGIPLSETHREHPKQAWKNRKDSQEKSIWMNNGTVRKKVPMSQTIYYESQGFYRGFQIRNN